MDATLVSAFDSDGVEEVQPIPRVLGSGNGVFVVLFSSALSTCATGARNPAAVSLRWLSRHSSIVADAFYRPQCLLNGSLDVFVLSPLVSLEIGRASCRERV